MKKVFLFIIAVFIIGCSSGEIGMDAGLSRISSESIFENIKFLASDSLKGRNTPSPELDVAGEFIAQRFKQYGLKPVNGSYFQKVEFVKVDLGDENHLVLSRNGESINFEIGVDFIPYNFGEVSVVALAVRGCLWRKKLVKELTLKEQKKR